MTPIRSFDIPADDPEALRAFYGGVFGWHFEEDVESPGNSRIVLPAPEPPPPMTGAIIPRSAPDQPIGVHFTVFSVEEASERIQRLGGVVFVPKTAIPGEGWYACCLDPERNYFVIREADVGAG